MSNDTWRICTKCNEYKTWDLYYKSDNSGSGHMSRCKDCYTYYNKHRESQKHAKVDKSLLEIEKAYKSKENKIIGQMNRVLKKDIVVKKETRSWSEVYLPKQPEKWEWEIIRIWENPVPFLSLYIK